MKKLLIAFLFVSALTSPGGPGKSAAPHEVGVALGIAPVYPPIAVTTNTSGDVEVDVAVDEAGNVTKAELVAGHPLLRRAAIEAARRWKFKATDKGTEVRLTFSFRIVPKETPEEEMTAAFAPPYRVQVKSKLPEPTVNYGHGDRGP